MIALRADVTANDDNDQALLRQFGIIGPPALLFFGPDGTERPEYRLVGFVDAAQFKQQVSVHDKKK
jgi:thiol:disulfide interchange protein DsbD